MVLVRGQTVCCCACAYVRYYLRHRIFQTFHNHTHITCTDIADMQLRAGYMVGPTDVLVSAMCGHDGGTKEKSGVKMIGAGRTRQARLSQLTWLVSISGAASYPVGTE